MTNTSQLFTNVILSLVLLMHAKTVSGGGWSCRDDEVSVLTNDDTYHENNPYFFTGKVFSVTKNDGSNYESDSNWVDIDYQYDGWDDKAGELKYLGTQKLDGYNVIAGNEFHEFGGFLFTPDVTNGWTGYLTFQYRISHTYYCGLTCTDWCSWGTVTLAVQPAENPTPHDDTYTVSRSDFNQYRNGYYSIKEWVMDNDNCSWNRGYEFNDNRPCVNTNLLLDGDESLTVLYGDLGGRVEKKAAT